MKICSKCKQIRSEFYPNKTSSDKLFSWCKNCCKEYRKRYNDYNKNYMLNYRKTKKGQQVRWEWLNKNKEVCATYKSKRKAAEGSHTAKEWEDLKYAFNYKCYVCNKFEPEIKLTKDHIIPISKDGVDNIENIIPLCRSCNCKKGTKGANWYLEQFKIYGVLKS